MAHTQSLINRAFAASAPDTRAKLVLVALAYHANADGLVFVSDAILEAATGLDARTLGDTISNLEDDFWLETGPGGSYRLMVENWS